MLHKANVCTQNAEAPQRPQLLLRPEIVQVVVADLRDMNQVPRLLKGVAAVVSATGAAGGKVSKRSHFRVQLLYCCNQSDSISQSATLTHNQDCSISSHQAFEVTLMYRSLA